MATIEELRAQIAQKRLELYDLETQLIQQENEANDKTQDDKEWSWPLLPEEYNRYSRQMIVPNFGLQGLSKSFLWLRQRY